MVFETSIFIPFDNKNSSLVLSEKISYFSLGIIAFSIILLMLNNFFFNIKTINFIILALMILGFLAIIGAGILRFFEYENLNGYFKGEIKIDSDAIKINDQHYNLSEISGLKLVIFNYKGQRTHNTRSGPSFYQGISNSISFSVNAEHIAVNFLLISKEHIDELYQILVSIIAQEKINYNRNLINLIPEKYRKSQEFKNFILKLILEKRLECTEGLLIHGYSSDEEAKQLRQKYCVQS